MRLGLGLALCTLVACSDTGRSGPEGRLEIATSALRLEGVEDACYALKVINGSDQTVFEVAHICADRFGDGRSAVTYIGTCDASEGNTEHIVELTLEGLYDAEGDPLEDYVNPAPAGSPIRLPATCIENADVPVTFNLVVARAARQGFIDTAINFDDVFCSAKLDCDAGDLLFDPISGERVPTAVMGLACTAGPDTDTHLYLTDVYLICDNAFQPIALDHAPGNFFSASAPSTGPVRQLATYQGVEQLTGPDGEDLSKVFFNTAVALDESATNCQFYAVATVSDGPLEACTTPEGIYPLVYIYSDTFLVDGELACGETGLGATFPVATFYTTPEIGTVTFATEVDGVGGDVVVSSCQTCGNDIVEAGEGCDPPDGDLACPYGEQWCQRCGPDCQWVMGNPSGRCGDGIVQSPHEVCDPPSADPTCYGAPCDICTATCQIGPGTVINSVAPQGCIEQGASTSEHCVTLKVSCDDDCEIYLDGVRHYGFTREHWLTQRTVVLDGIAAGCHVLGVRTSDVYRVAAGFIGTVAIDDGETTIVSVSSPHLTVSPTATNDADGDTWSELDYDLVFPPAVQCSPGAANTWRYHWEAPYYSIGAAPIWYNSDCTGDATEAYARIVFTVENDGTMCNRTQGVSRNGGTSWTPLP